MIRKVEVIYLDEVPDSAQWIEIRGVIFKAADGTTIDEVLGNGYKTKT